MLAVGAEYIKMADNFVHVPGGPNNHNYANVELIGVFPTAIISVAIFSLFFNNHGKMKRAMSIKPDACLSLC
jgi:hypothetical protein